MTDCEVEFSAECALKVMKTPDIDTKWRMFWFEEMIVFDKGYNVFKGITWWPYTNELRYVDHNNYCPIAAPTEVTKAYENWLVETCLLEEELNR